MRKNKAMKICTLIVMLVLVIATSKLFSKVSYGAENDEKAILEGALDKYVNYELNDGTNGTLVQYSLRTGIEYGDEFFAIKNSELNVSLNQIDGKYPYDVRVIGKSTKVTNGKTNSIDEDYNYDSNTGLVTIRANNENENGKPIYNNRPAENDRDEFVVIAYYDTYTKEKPERDLSCNATYKAILFTEDNREVTGQGALNQKVTEDLGELTSVNTTRNDIYNGYIKSNVINGTTYDTEYTENNEIMISKKEAHQKINITEENTFVNLNDIYYKSTKILKEDFLNILGENGKIEIFDGDDNLIATIDNNTGFNENGEALIVYPENINNITIKTSDIINEGILHVENVKKIKGDALNIDDKDIDTKISIVGINDKEIQKENKNGEINTEIVEEESYRNEKENTIEIKDSTTNVGVDIDNTNWTNEKQNEVTFDIYLNSSSISNNLFSNPTIRIKLPSGVEKVILNNSSIMYANGLNMQEPYLETEKDGTTSIVVNLDGAQTAYNENNLGLNTDIKLSTSIILNNDIETGLGNVAIDYANNYTVDGSSEQGSVAKTISMENFQENQANESQPVSTSTENTNDIVSTVSKAVEEKVRAEVLAATQDEIDSLKITVEPTRGDTTLQDGDTVYEGEFIKYNIKIENISSQNINNVRIVGTIPEGTKYGELDRNFEFSDNRKYQYNFDESLKEKEINIGTVKAGQVIEQSYEVQVKDLEDGDAQKQIVTNIKAYIGDTQNYNYVLNNTIEPAEAKAFLWSMSDGINDEWAYGINLDIQEGKQATIKLTLPQIFSISQSNIDDGRIYMEAYRGAYSTSIFLDQDDTTEITDFSYTFNGTEVTITTSESGTYKLGLIIGDTSSLESETVNGETEFKANAIVTVDDKEYRTNENTITYNIPEVTIKMSSDNEGEEVKYEEEIDYKISVTATSTSPNKENPELEDVYVNISDYLPENVNPISVTYEYFEEEFETVNGEDGEVQVPVGYGEKQVTTEDLYSSVTDDDGNELPDVDLDISIPKGETINITIRTTAGYVTERTEIANSAVVQTPQVGQLDEAETIEEIETKTSNVVKHIILPVDLDGEEETETPEEPTEPEDPDNPGTTNPDDPNNPSNPSARYNISGIAWRDDNADGERQNDETLLSGIQVMLVDLEDTSNVMQETVTNNGRYTFSNLEQGNYIVVFIYNTSMYRLTEYRKSGVANTVNSDASQQTILLNGKETNAGVTDAISLNQEQSNVDIGLIENNSCDLKLDKYITEVSVTTNNGTKQYSYDNTKLGRVEIRSKELNGAEVEVTYRIVVTNEGKTPATVREIYDYLPEGLSFSSNGNSTWKNENGVLINRSLMNQEIAAGESKEVYLTLTKTMGEEDTGTFTNAAEIGSINNSAGIQDTDSTPGNRSKSEDDYSEAQLIISVSTGLAMYISIGVIALIIVILTILAIKFKFKIGKISKISKLGVSIMLFVLVGMFSCGNVFAVRFHYVSYNKHKFSGGPTGTGYCTNHSWVAAGWNTRIDGKNAGCDHSETKYTKSKTTGTKKYSASKDKETEGIELSKRGSGQISVKQNGNNYIVGPFQITTNSTGKDITVYDRNNKELDGWVLCDSNGKKSNPLSKTGNVDFYISLSASLYERGISRVTLTQSKKQTYSRYWYKKGQVYYTYDPDTRCYSYNQNRKHQGVKTTTYVYDEGYDKTTKNTSKTVEWTATVITGSLDIIKVDADDTDVKLDIQGTLEKNDGTYSKNFTTTNGTYHFDNLPAGTYILTEKVNNNYGYEQEINEEIQISVKGGITQEVVITNKKQTGNLKIVKKDQDSNTTLENVGFKIMDSSGKYIIAIDENGESLTEIKGTVYLSNMQTTDNEAQATEFITDSNGEINIYNMKVGAYDVKETSIGDNNYGYEIDDEYISWDDGTQSGIGDTAIVEVTRQRSYNTSQDTNIVFDDQKTIDDGVYEIQTGVKSNMVVDVTSSYAYDGANVAIYQRNNSLAQQFYVKYLGEGYYTITALCANKNINVKAGGTTPGTNVEIYEKHNRSNQQWVIKSCGDGYYTIMCKGNNLYLDVADGATANKTNIQVYTGNNSNAQKFKFNDLTEVSTASENTLTVNNERKWVKLSGNVWEDMISGKTSERDSLYDATGDDEANPDKLVANVTVRLKDRDENTIQEVSTDSNGHYVMENVLIDELSNYYIEFSYNGMSYTSVPIVDILLGNGTKAIENSGTRTTFNNNYSTITHQGVTDPIGQANNQNGDKTYNLNYDEGEYNSTLNYGPNSKDRDAYGYDGQNFPVNPNKIDGQYVITATTRDAFTSVANDDNGYSGYLSDIKSADQIRKENITEITDINLGLREREQPDVALVQDIDNAKITLNGYEHTYYYNQRFANQEVPEGFDVGVKFGNEYGSANYTQTIYSSDVVYNEQYGGENGVLGVYVTYKVALRNEATNLYTRVNEVTNYFDNRYSTNNITVTDEDGNALNYEVDSNYNNNGFRKMTIQANQNLVHQKQRLIYITYKLENDAVNAVLNGDLTLDSVSEISSYSTYSDENFTIHYAGVDKDSRPGSARPENRNNPNDDTNKATYEDDTDKAPSFVLQLSESEGRAIRGTVWEDNAIEELLNKTGYDKERKGDGIYVNGENVVEQVKVEMLACDGSGNPTEIASLYKKDQVRAGNVVKEPEAATTNTDQSGNYEFSGIIPGKYVIRYTYGNSSVIVKPDGSKQNVEVEKYKSTIYRSGNKGQAEAMNDYWYRAETGEGTTRMSDAIDTTGIRKDGSTIDDIIQYRTREEQTYNYGTIQEENNTSLESIEANTRLFDIRMDYDVNLDNISQYGEQLKFVFDNIDLGIIRRPIQNIDVRKEIAYVQVKLANGQVVIEGDPREGTINHLRFLPDGNIHVELDSELLQGATLTIRYEIVVDNTNAEIDYNDRDYYIYGTPQNSSNWKLANISKLFDYLSNGLVYDENNTDNTNNWTQITKLTKEELVDSGILSEDAFDVVKGYNQILQTTAFSDMQPNEVRRVPLVVSRVLSNNGDDITFDNDIEVNELTNRRMEHDGDYTTPGDYVPSETGRVPGGDDDYVYLTVTGPTGEDKNYIPYIILGISSFIILGAGIIFIKKKVL